MSDIHTDKDRILDPLKHRFLYENDNIRLVVVRFFLMKNG